MYSSCPAVGVPLSEYPILDIECAGNQIMLLAKGRSGMRLMVNSSSNLGVACHWSKTKHEHVHVLTYIGATSYNNVARLWRGTLPPTFYPTTNAAARSEGWLWGKGAARAHKQPRWPPHTLLACLNPEVPQHRKAQGGNAHHKHGRGGAPGPASHAWL